MTLRMLEMWKMLVDLLDPTSRANLTAYCLRTRRRSIPIQFNGTCHMVPRATLRDYLVEKKAPT